MLHLQKRKRYFCTFPTIKKVKLNRTQNNISNYVNNNCLQLQKKTLFA